MLGLKHENILWIAFVVGIFFIVLGRLVDIFNVAVRASLTLHVVSRSSTLRRPMAAVVMQNVVTVVFDSII